MPRRARRAGKPWTGSRSRLSRSLKRSADYRRCPYCGRKGALTSWWDCYWWDEKPVGFWWRRCRYCGVQFNTKAQVMKERGHETEGSQAEEGVQTDTQQEVEHDEGRTAGVAPPAEGA